MIRLAKLLMLAPPHKPMKRKENPSLVKGPILTFSHPLPPYRLSLPMSAQCIKTCPLQNKDQL